MPDVGRRPDQLEMNGQLVRIISVAVAVCMVMGCGTVEPMGETPVAAIILTVDARYQEALEEVTAVLMRVTPAHYGVRDTIVSLSRDSQGGVQFRAVLRPDEVGAGTLIETLLQDGGAELFYGRAVLDRDGPWLLRADIPLKPIAILVVAVSWISRVGWSIRLADLGSVQFLNGLPVPDAAITWTVSNPDVVEIVGGRAVARDVGSAAIVAHYAKQADTVSVSVR